MAKMIDLGRQTPDYGELEPAAPEEPKKTKTVYPDLYIESEQAIELPDSGKATIEFEVRRREVSKRRGKPTKHEITIEVKSITPQGTKKPTTEEVLDQMVGIKE